MRLDDAACDRKTEAELLSYKNFGETTLQEIRTLLAQKGLRLGMALGDPLTLSIAAASAVSGTGSPSAQRRPAHRFADGVEDVEVVDA